MTRPLRLEYPGALYHVTSRGNAQAEIFLCDDDREQFVSLLRDEVGQQGWVCYAWCLMDNHYHFLIETPEANLSRGMQRLNGRYTQVFNRRHGRVGHVFQGRYKAILVERDSHLLELCRYIVLNPVRAGMVEEAGEWRWSSHNDVLRGRSDGGWLAVDALLDLFSPWRKDALDQYVRFVAEGVCERPWELLRGQVYLGGEAFLAEVSKKLERISVDRDIPSVQQHPERPEPKRVLADVASVYGVEVDDVLDRRNQPESYQAAVYLLRRVCNLSLNEVARLADISIGRVSQIQASMRDKGLPEGLENYKV